MSYEHMTDCDTSTTSAPIYSSARAATGAATPAAPKFNRMMITGNQRPCSTKHSRITACTNACLLCLQHASAELCVHWHAREVTISSPLALLFILVYQQPLQVAIYKTPEEAVAITPGAPHAAILLLELADLVDKHLAAIYVLCYNSDRRLPQLHTASPCRRYITDSCSAAAWSTMRL